MEKRRVRSEVHLAIQEAILEFKKLATLAALGPLLGFFLLRFLLDYFEYGEITEPVIYILAGFPVMIYISMKDQHTSSLKDPDYGAAEGLVLTSTVAGSAAIAGFFTEVIVFILVVQTILIAIKFAHRYKDFPTVLSALVPGTVWMTVSGIMEQGTVWLAASLPALLVILWSYPNEHFVKKEGTK